ncbi:MAG: multiubiquitin domain-containing protein [Gammaproteobacteria bacterium]|nr:multiubiquitin domain-containing protein [Gammaproteobacteria bacterium]
MSISKVKPDGDVCDGQKKYEIRVDDKLIVVNDGRLKGEEILALVQKDYAEWTLNQKFRGGRRKPVQPDQEVDITDPEIERFETVKKQAQQGMFGL